MALRVVSRDGARPLKYEPHIVLEGIYAPLVRKGIPLHLQCNPAEFSAKRADGCLNIDLWVDGSLYPKHPLTGLSPSFRNVKGLLEFCCHGENGFLGYTKALSQNDVWSAEKSLLSQRIIQLQIELDELHASKARLEVDSIEIREGMLATLRSKHAEQLKRVECEWQEKVTTLKGVNSLVRSDVNFLQRKLATAMRSHAFAEIRARNSRGLESLAEGSGNTKKRVMQIRNLLGGPKMMEETQDDNRLSKKRKRLCGDSSTQCATGGALARMLSKTEATAILDTPKFNSVANQLVEDTLKKIGSTVSPEAVLAACDMTGVSHRGYGEIFKTLKGRIGLVNKKFKSTILPKPYQVRIILNVHLFCSLYFIVTIFEVADER